MRLIVDSNILFTFFWKNSVFKEISAKQDLELFSPEFALKEINKYSAEIIRKTKISKEEFKKAREELVFRVEFVSLENYLPFLKKAMLFDEGLMENEIIEISNDADFFALSLKLNCPLWSNDKLLKKQSKVVVFNTKELINLIGNLED